MHDKGDGMSGANAANAIGSKTGPASVCWTCKDGYSNRAAADHLAADEHMYVENADALTQKIHAYTTIGLHTGISKRSLSVGRLRTCRCADPHANRQLWRWCRQRIAKLIPQK
mmetsp:Transcript_22694/g.52318  ORF Transcript_22694/g.52318 Transcript_22694/m.52318 type:complete len:113 (-) Transcript_22694:397-735(-)